ncbi:anti-sigma-I factor RsgI family protein [Neobacillus soli]|uniref:anti-sigma-I factor RsgI family protein n=1 Tax=Neobacillus soli TaxID=220688 RepID=UPI00082461A2|nr:anti-sigma factor domain-containing protein [Neobacillus soli]
MKKGIIMEIDEAILTLLTPEGEFLHAKRLNQPYIIGEEIQFFPIVSMKTSSNLISYLKNLFKLKSVWAVIAALFIFLGSFIPMYQNNKAYAYMSIDVNPSIELGVNKKMQVVELTGFNNEGKKIISQIDNWRNKDVSRVTQAILAEMKNEGFLKTKEHVIISTARTKESEKNVEEKFQQNMQAIKETVKNQHLELTLLTSTEKELKKAHELGITAGKYQENKIQSALKKRSKEKVRTIENNQEGNGLPSRPAKTVQPGQLKKQIMNQSVQNKRIPENKLQKEKRWDDWKKMPPGQLKKQKEEQLKHDQGKQKKQSYQKENVNENKKTKHGEKQNGKHRNKHNGKYNEKHNNEKHNNGKHNNEKHNNGKRNNGKHNNEKHNNEKRRSN